jgi:hypothetical protein
MAIWCRKDPTHRHAGSRGGKGGGAHQVTHLQAGSRTGQHLVEQVSKGNRRTAYPACALHKSGKSLVSLTMYTAKLLLEVGTQVAELCCRSSHKASAT